MVISCGQVAVINSLLFLCGFKSKEKKEELCLSLLIYWFCVSFQLAGLILTD